ncbi:MAG TPA: hypothetical protein VIX83_03195 [Candidatus Cybelea sp.]
MTPRVNELRRAIGYKQTVNLQELVERGPNPIQPLKCEPVILFLDRAHNDRLTVVQGPFGTTKERLRVFLARQDAARRAPAARNRIEPRRNAQVTARSVIARYFFAPFCSKVSSKVSPDCRRPHRKAMRHGPYRIAGRQCF